jgi:acyl carrier protein
VRAAARELQAPRDALEEALAGMVADVLGIDRVGVTDGFFELGGNSLRAMELVARVEEAFAVDLPLRALFDQPTVAGLIEVLARTHPRELLVEAAQILTSPDAPG